MEDPPKMPEQWLKFITNEKRCYSGPSRYKFWMRLYRRALSAIPVDEYGHNNNAYAKILVDFAKLQAKTSEDEARSIFQAARNNVKRCSLVYVAWAQFELEHNNRAKCEKLLKKGKQFFAEPTGLLDMALGNFTSGNPQLIDEETEEHTFTELINRNSSSSGDDTGGAGPPPEKHLGAGPSGSGPSEHGYLATSTRLPEELPRSAVPVFTEKSGEIKDDGKRREEIQNKAASVEVAHLSHEQDFKSSSKPQQPVDLSEFSLPIIHSKYRGSSGSSESSEEIDTLSSLFSRNKVSVQSNKESVHGAVLATPQTVKATPESSSVSTSKQYPPASSSSSVDRKQGWKRLGFVGLPRRAPLPINELEIKEELKEDEKPDCQIPRHKGDDSLDGGVFPLVTAAAATPQQRSTSQPPAIQSRQSACSIPGAAISYKQEQARPEILYNDAIKHKRNYEHNSGSSYPQNSGQQIPSGAVRSCYGACEPARNGAVPPALPISAPLTSDKVLVVNGKAYTKLNNIGRGGSSKVYRVFDGEKTCAIKCVNVEDADADVIQSYINEITLLKRLQGYESIIKLYDWEMDEVGKVIKLVLEIGCIDLAGYMRKNPEKITSDFIKLCWKQILDAVKVVHDEGIVHTDLKPANFLLVEGNLKLIDFGIANAIQGDTTSFMRDTQIGTANYMSPEALKDISQIQHPSGHHKPIMKIGRASDVWSLGCILYTMVYGKTPFQHITNRMKKCMCIMDPSFEIKFPKIDNVDLCDTMKGCLKRNPKERYTIPQLQHHRYLTGKTKVVETVDEDVQSVLNCIMQMKQVNSPNTFKNITQNMLRQLSSQKQPSRPPFHQMPSTSVDHQERKNKTYFARSLEGDKENA